MPRTNPTAYWAALAAALFGVGGAFLIAASQTSCDGWVTAFVISGIGGILVAIYIFGALFVGRGLPDLGEERRLKKLQREEEALRTYYSRVHALDEVITELRANARDLANELDSGQTFGLSYSATYWNKNEHLLSAPELAATRELVSDAYSKTMAVGQRNRERYLNASHDEVNDPTWRALTDEEKREREEALEAVEEAVRATLAVRAQVEP